MHDLPVFSLDVDERAKLANPKGCFIFFFNNTQDCVIGQNAIVSYDEFSGDDTAYPSELVDVIEVIKLPLKQVTDDLVKQEISGCFLSAAHFINQAAAQPSLDRYCGNTAEPEITENSDVLFVRIANPHPLVA